MEVFCKIKLAESDINKLYFEFCQIDVQSSGYITMQELYAYFSLELTTFNRELFRIYDNDGNGQMNFLEFVCVVGMPIRQCNDDTNITAMYSFYRFGIS